MQSENDDEYTNKEYIELLTRWFQYGTFTPLFRIHGYVSKTEIWRYGKEFENMAHEYIDLRYKLMPYIYSEAWKITSENSILMRPLVYDFQNDKNVWNIKDQFMFGDAMMICPVVTYQARSREVYLPEGLWYNYYTNEKFEGGKTYNVAATLEQIPIFVKAGSIIPQGPEIQYATQKINEPIEIVVYEGEDGTFSLYQDDEISYEYEKGNFSLIKIEYMDKTIVFEDDKGSFFDYNSSSIKFKIKFVSTGMTKEITYKGKRIECALNN